MASTAEVPLDQLLKYKTWVLKVSIHCEGCKRKVKRVLHKINGVYTVSIDSQKQRVTVTGNVDVETLIKRLVKTGKHAEIWPENLAGEEKKVPGKSKNNGKENDPQSKGNSTNENNSNQSTKMEAQAKVSTNTTTTASNETEKSKEREEIQRSKERESSSEKFPSGEPKRENGGRGSKRKKMQGQKGNCSNNVGARSGNGCAPACTGIQAHHNDQGTANQGVNNVNYTQRYSYPYYYPHGSYNTNWPSSLVYANRSYTSPHPSKAPAQFCYPSSWPYTCPSSQQELYNNCYGSFEIFSDENANGCSIM